MSDSPLSLSSDFSLRDVVIINMTIIECIGFGKFKQCMNAIVTLANKKNQAFILESSGSQWLR